MFKTLINAFKVQDIRRRLLYTFFILVVVRLGSLITVPGISADAIREYMQNALGDSLNIFSSFTGGSFEQMSIFALSVTPYITASIIIQLLTIAIPALEELQKDGEDGRKKITAITRYMTVGLAILESTGLVVGFGNKGVIENYNFWTVFCIVVILTAGSAIVMWLGERATEKGVGNGISVILLINIVSTMPNDFKNLYTQFMKGRDFVRLTLVGLVILAVVVLTVVFVCALQGAERRIPVQYSQKVSGRKTFGGQSTNIPLKVNTAGVMPVIFASSLMQFPVIIAQLFGKSYEWTRYLSSSYWCRVSAPKYSLGLILYVVLLIIFAYFYTSITFNPIEVADNLKKAGGVIPGITPGKSTSDYLNNILNYIVFVGAVGLLIIALIPIMCTGFFNASVSFGGTSVIIIVGVVLETLKQIESQMVNRYYKGFLSE